mgnify:CR=1 FL=1|tara:strand:+ start:8840 stop:9076 length:237 start_codon:yes stop_codon:yes gene_type:complete
MYCAYFVYVCRCKKTADFCGYYYKYLRIFYSKSPDSNRIGDRIRFRGKFIANLRKLKRLIFARPPLTSVNRPRAANGA